MYISIHALVEVLMVCIIVVVSVFVIIAVLNVIKFFRLLVGIITDNRSNINRTLSLLPSALESTNDVLVSANDAVLATKNNMEQMSHTLSAVRKKFDIDSGTVRGEYSYSEKIFNSLYAIGEAIKAIVSFLYSFSASKNDD